MNSQEPATQKELTEDVIDPSPDIEGTRPTTCDPSSDTDLVAPKPIIPERPNNESNSPVPDYTGITLPVDPAHFEMLRLSETVERLGKEMELAAQQSNKYVDRAIEKQDSLCLKRARLSSDDNIRNLATYEKRMKKAEEKLKSLSETTISKKEFIKFKESVQKSLKKK